MNIIHNQKALSLYYADIFHITIDIALEYEHVEHINTRWNRLFHKRWLLSELGSSSKYINRAFTWSRAIRVILTKTPYAIKRKYVEINGVITPAPTILNPNTPVKIIERWEEIDH